MDEYEALNQEDHLKQMEDLISQLNHKLAEQKKEDNEKIRGLENDKSELEKRIKSAESTIIELTGQMQTQLNEKNDEIKNLNGYLESYHIRTRNLEEHIAKQFYEIQRASRGSKPVEEVIAEEPENDAGNMSPLDFSRIVTGCRNSDEEKPSSDFRLSGLMRGNSSKSKKTAFTSSDKHNGSNEQARLTTRKCRAIFGSVSEPNDCQNLSLRISKGPVAEEPRDNEASDEEEKEILKTEFLTNANK